MKDKDQRKQNKTPEVREDRPSRADFHHGSTTQGGSNFGQGSNDLDKHAIRQGSEANDGASYDNERGWDNEALRREDMKDTVPKKDASRGAKMDAEKDASRGAKKDASRGAKKDAEKDAEKDASRGAKKDAPIGADPDAKNRRSK